MNIKANIEQVVLEARHCSPEEFLRGHFANLEFNRNRNSLRIEGVLRADLKPNGIWIACDWYGGGIGDPISIVRYITGCGFMEAVDELIKSVGLAVISKPTPISAPVLTRPNIPWSVSPHHGRKYLLSRGISKETILLAEERRFLTYVDNAIMFLGRDWDNQEIRLASLRYYKPVIVPPFKKLTNKRDLSGSCKDFPLLLPGEKRFIAIVEGGVNALATRDLFLENDIARPTVIATGGVGILNWLQVNDNLKSIVQKADTIWLIAENEIKSETKTQEWKQKNTDVLREKTIEGIIHLRDGKPPFVIYPPEGAKDIADWHKEFPSESPLFGWDNTQIRTTLMEMAEEMEADFVPVNRW